MVEAAPAASFEVAQAQFLFQFLIIAFDDPALFRQSDQVAQWCFPPGSTSSICAVRFRRGATRSAATPALAVGELVVAMCRANAHGGEAGAQGMSCTFPPGDGFPGFGRQAQRQLLG
jgi:hypothetical protein